MDNNFADAAQGVRSNNRPNGTQLNPVVSLSSLSSFQYLINFLTAAVCTVCLSVCLSDMVMQGVCRLVMKSPEPRRLVTRC